MGRKGQGHITLQTSCSCRRVNSAGERSELVAPQGGPNLRKRDTMAGVLCHRPESHCDRSRPAPRSGRSEQPRLRHIYGSQKQRKG